MAAGTNREKLQDFKFSIIYLLLLYVIKVVNEF